MIGDSEPLGGYPAYQGLKGRREAEVAPMSKLPKSSAEERLAEVDGGMCRPAY